MGHAASPSEFLQDGRHNGPRITHIDSKMRGHTPAGGHDIIECFDCGFKHALPLPDPLVLEREYRDNYYAGEKPNFIAHAGEDQNWFELAQNDRLEIFEKLLPASRRRLLDIGCGPGFFLATAMKRGWDANGIEPSRQAAAHARGLGPTITEGLFNKQSATALGRFDAVNLTNVLEHVPNPIAILEMAIGMVDKDGVICVGVPNDFSPLQIAARGVLNTGDWWVAPPHHLNYFDFDSLGALMTRLGLKIAERTTSFPMEAFLMMGENYVADPGLGRACHNKRKRFDFAFEAAGLRETRRDLYRAMAKLGLGREAVVIAVKP